MEIKMNKNITHEQILAVYGNLCSFDLITEVSRIPNWDHKIEELLQKHYQLKKQQSDKKV